MNAPAPSASAPRSILARALLVVIAGASLTLAACNTTAGAGRDIQSAGRGIEGAAEEAK